VFEPYSWGTPARYVGRKSYAIVTDSLDGVDLKHREGEWRAALLLEITPSG
jgi:hypothetical protein